MSLSKSHAIARRQRCRRTHPRSAQSAAIIVALLSIQTQMLPAQAFGIVRHASSRLAAFQNSCRAAAAAGTKYSTDDEGATLDSLKDALHSMRDSLKIQSPPPPPLSDEAELNNNLSPEDIIRQSILSTRISNLNLNRTRVDQSLMPQAGRGLFATAFIAKGDIVTCYPGDALLYASPVSTSNSGGEDSDDDEYEWAEEYVIWSAHVPNADQWAEDAVFDGIEAAEGGGALSAGLLTSYACEIDANYSVMGLPTLDSDPSYLGHFANDGAGHLAMEKPDPSMGVEESLSKYVLESLELSNAMHQEVDGLHMTTVATRDIEVGSEILVCYGVDYWIGSMDS